jgi:hypothetical protein
LTISINISPEFTLIKQHRYRTINLYSICQHFFLPVYAYFSNCWHRLNGLFQHVILWILKTMIPKLIIKIKYSNYKINSLSKCQKYNNFKSHSVIVFQRGCDSRSTVFEAKTLTIASTMRYMYINLSAWHDHFQIYSIMT